MELGNLNNIYFLGIGGIGMSALARFFNHKGIHISGYDRTRTKLCMQMEKEGILIHYEEDIKQIPEKPDLVIFTPAIPAENTEFIHIKKKGWPLKKRAEILGLLSHEYFTIAVAGTHGKTTICSMIAHILKNVGMDPAAFIGGITKNFNSNLILSEENNILITEADEYDRSFLNLSPDITVISAMDADHLDIYGNKENLVKSFKQFIKKTKPGGTVIVNSELDIASENVRQLKYGLFSGDIYASEYSIRDGKSHLIVNTTREFEKAPFELIYQYPGRHNAENMLAAISVALCMDIPPEKIANAAVSYAGVERRFDVRLLSEKIIYIDDYAHHPEEIKSVICAVREYFPDKRICGIFQPHLYSRTADFADEFAKSLESLDKIILLEIYPAREKPIKGVNARLILDKIFHTDKQIVPKEKLLESIEKIETEIILTMGAGDIDQLTNSIKQKLEERV